MSPRILVLLAVLGLALAGCADDPEPKLSAEPTPTVAASPVTATPTPEQETPEDFIRRWAQASLDMQNSGQVESFVSLNSPDCEPCRKLSDLVSGYYGAGGSVVAQPWKFQNVKLKSGSTFKVDVITEPTKFRTSAGATESATDGGPVTFSMTLKTTGSGWQMANYVQLPR